MLSFRDAALKLKGKKWDGKQLPPMEELKQCYLSKHGRWKDREECKRLASLGEGADPQIYGSARSEVDITPLLHTEVFEDHMKGFKTALVVSVSLDFFVGSKTFIFFNF